MGNNKQFRRSTRFWNEWKESLLFLTIWVALFIFAYRDVFSLGQFAFSEQEALPKDAARSYFRLFIHPWSPYGHGIPQLPQGVESFYAYPRVWSYTSRLGAFSFFPASHFFMALVFSIFSNSALAQHAFYYPLVPLSGITMYIFLSRFRLSFICKCVASFVYSVNPITIMAFLGGGPGKMTSYMSQPLILLFLLNLLEGKGNRIRNVLMISLFSAFACSFETRARVMVSIIMLPTIVYILFERKKKYTLTTIASVFAIFAITFILILPYSFYVLQGLLSQSALSFFKSASSKYSIESVLEGMRHVYSASTPINLLRIQPQVGAPSWWYGGSDKWNVLGFAYPLLAFTSLLFVRNNTRSRHILLFSFMAVFPLLFCWMTNLGYTSPLFIHFPLLFIYNSPEYLIYTTLVAYPPLIAITISELKKRLFSHAPKFKNRINNLAIILLFLLVISSVGAYVWPIFTGDMGMSLLSKVGYQVPQNAIVAPVYYEMADWISAHELNDWDFRVTLLPFFRETHYGSPILGVRVLVPPPGVLDALLSDQTDHLGILLGLFGVKYIFINLRIPGIDIPIEDPMAYVKHLNSQKDLRLVENRTDFLVYKNENFVPLISVYERAFYLTSITRSTSPLNEIIMLSAMPDFNMTQQLLFFGNSSSVGDSDWALSRANTLVFFGGSNASIQYIDRTGSELLNLVYVFKPGDDLTYSAKSLYGESGYIASFDGKSGYIQVPSSPSINTSFTAMTITTWVYPLERGRAIYSNPTSAHGGSVRWCLNDRWYTPAGPVPPMDGTFPQPKLNDWILVAVVFNGTHLLSYQNAILTDCTTSDASSFNLSGPNYIGAYLGKSDFYKGFITNFQVYNEALTPTQIQQLYEGGLSTQPIPDAGLVGWWPLNQSSGKTAYDLSGNSNHGTLKGGTNWRPIDVKLYVTKIPWASLGYCLKTEETRSRVVNGSFYAFRNGFYGVALRAATSKHAGNVSISIDGKPAVSLSVNNQFKWCEAPVLLTKGLHRIDIFSKKPTFLDQLVIYYSISQQNLTLKEIFSSPRQISCTPREISWTEYSVDITCTRPSFLVLWQSFHPDWSAYSGGMKLHHFNAIWANGFYLYRAGLNHVKIYFTQQETRNIVLSFWAIAWIILIGSIIYLSRKNFLTYFRG